MASTGGISLRVTVASDTGSADGEHAMERTRKAASAALDVLFIRSLIDAREGTVHHRDTESTEGHREIFSLSSSVALCVLCVSVVNRLLVAMAKRRPPPPRERDAVLLQKPYRMPN
jgi:hypothetical protein